MFFNQIEVWNTKQQSTGFGAQHHIAYQQNILYEFKRLFYMVDENNEGNLKKLHAITKLELANMTQALCITSFDTRVLSCCTSQVTCPWSPKHEEQE